MTSALIASALHLDRVAIKALRISDVYSLHRVVYNLFEDVRSPDEKIESVSSGILWADQGGDFQGRKILLLSNRAPIPRISGQHGIVVSKVIAPEFLNHNSYRFKVIVNPTRRSNANRNLLPIKGREEIAKWFLDRAPTSWGFSALPSNLQIDRTQTLQFQAKSNRTVTLAQAHIQGILSVTDVDRFRLSFATGIGRGRAFGCGLLQIVPNINNHFTN